MKTLSAVPFEAQRTALFDLHQELAGASAIPWQGYHVPSHYHSILEEHRAAITDVALFDLGYRGILELEGPQAQALLEEVGTRCLTDMPVGALWQLPICYPDGLLADLSYLWRESAHSWTLYFPSGVGSSALGWVVSQASSLGCWVQEQSRHYAWVALAGGQARALLSSEGPLLRNLPAGTATDALLQGVACHINSIADDYFMICCQPELVGKVVRRWQQSCPQLRLCGWASYENWRLERGDRRYGHELREGSCPYELGMDDLIVPSAAAISRQALLQRQLSPQRLLIHFWLDAMRLPREGFPVYSEGRMVGAVIDGGFSPRIGKPIGAAWVNTNDVDFDRLEVEIRRQRFPISIRKFPII
jgi:aminomethyltransferase